MSSSKIDIDINSNELKKEDIEIIDKNFINLVTKIKNKDYNPILIQDDEKNNKDFYCFSLDLYKNKKEFSNISKLVEDFYYNNSLRDRINQKAHHFKKILSNKLNRLINKYQNLENELIVSENKEEFKIFADILSVNIYKIKKGRIL